MNLIRNLIALYICIIMLPLCSLAFNSVVNIPFEYNEVNDELALFQLREIMLISYDLNYSRDQIDFIYKNKEFRLSLVNNKLILQPGTQIFLYDVDDLYFDIKDNCIFVNYERNNKKFEKAICSLTGIHLDEFSDCDVCDVEPDYSEE